MNLLLLLLPLATELLDLQMSPEEKRKTGVQKLSEKQKSSLQLWIDNHYEKRDTPLEGRLPQKKPKVDQIECKGNETIIHLTDTSLWQIRPKDSPIARSWINPEVGIIIHPSTDPDFPTLLTNTLSGSTVHAIPVKEALP
jgi:hypothetical protein